MPEDNVPAIQKRLHDGAVLTVEAYDRANTTKLADGTLQTVDNQIDTTTGTIKMRALFDNEDGALFANQFVNIRLLQDVLKDQVIIPIAAVQHGAPEWREQHLRLPGERRQHGRRCARSCWAPPTASAWRVASGLQAGDVVVTEGGDRLRDGAPVTLPQAPATLARHGAPRASGRRHAAPASCGADGKAAHQGPARQRPRRRGAALRRARAASPGCTDEPRR